MYSAMTAIVLFASISVVRAEEIWQVVGGGTTVTLNRALARDLGIQFTQITETAPPFKEMEDPVGFAVLPSSNYQFRVRGGGHREVISGNIVQKGGFTIVANGRNFRIEDFAITPVGIIPSDGYVLRAASDKGIRYFDLKHPQVPFSRKEGTLGIRYLDMAVTKEFALRMGRPDLEGCVLGCLTVLSQANKLRGEDVQLPPPAGDPGTDFVPTDVKLEAMSGLSYQGRIGTYPTGRVAFAMQTTSCNASATTNINWYSPNQGTGNPMDPRHPLIMQNLYRLKDGRLEQIGFAWIKHGFLATNASSCASGSCSGSGGPILFPKCTDTYGVGNNNDRNYLGPRGELNAFSGVWTAMNSFFANYSGNTWQPHGSGWNAIDHRLEVEDSDLVATGSPQFFYEAYYITPDDIDLYNNVGSRRATITWTGTTWSVTTADAQIFGPTLQTRWPGSTSTIALPKSEGDNWVAVKTTDLGGGNWRYDFAVYNHNSDRKVNQFAVPIQPGAVVTNMGFHDVDTNAANNWTASAAGGYVTFMGPDYGTNPTGNALPYSTQYNFWFDANVPPVSSVATIGLFKPGSYGYSTAALSGPTYDFVSPFTYQLIQGIPGSGNIASLYAVDFNRLTIQLDDLTPNSEVVFNGRATSSTATELRFKIVTNASRTDMMQQILLYNFQTGQYEPPADTRTTTLANQTVEIVVSTNASRFISTVDQSVRAKLGTFPNVESDAYDGFGVGIDYVGWKTTP